MQTTNLKSEPAFDPPIVHAIDPRMRWFWAVSYSLFSLPLWGYLGMALWTGRAVSVHRLVIALLLALLIIAAAVWYARVAYRRFGYALLEDGVWVQSGVFWRRATFVPRARIQHTEVQHGPLDRKMRLAKLVLYTAGLRILHVTIPGLTQERAHALRDALLRR